jgi:hypothetical protein
METSPTETNGLRTGASLLETLTSALYADPIVVFREYVQNAIDGFSRSHPKSPGFKVDISLLPGQKQIVIYDNGGGIPTDKFDETMRGLGRSTKTSGQLGFRGIGRFAGLSFCNKLHFINRGGQETQVFSFDGEKYRKILLDDKMKYWALDKVIEEIVSTKSQSDVLQGLSIKDDYSFMVLLENVSDDLLDCIYQNKPTRGRSGEQEKIAIVESTNPTEDFFNSLSLLLPVPYIKGFTDADKIRQKYSEWFKAELSSREFDVYLNAKQLFKPFQDATGTDFRILPIKIMDLLDDEDKQSRAPQTIGLLWMRFDYVFKAVKQNWGIAVRSKNMLVRGGSVLAEVDAEDRDAITSYGQYLSAIKGVTGELLLETQCLLDNSRRDWFKMDKNSLQLRNQLCKLVSRMHIYRYKISHYMHNDRKPEEEKQQVIAAFRDLVCEMKDDTDATAVEQYMAERIREENANEIDERADERDILGYTTTQKRFYRTLMMAVYDYFEKKEITEYYALKCHVLQNLNCDSIDTDGESTTGGK